MAVRTDPFDDEDEDFRKVHAITRRKGGFGKNTKYPPFYVSFNSREVRDAARRPYGNLCLNCGEEKDFAPECLAKFLNLSGLIHPAVGDGTPEEAKRRCRKLQGRLRQWAKSRSNQNDANP